MLAGLGLKICGLINKSTRRMGERKAKRLCHDEGVGWASIYGPCEGGAQQDRQPANGPPQRSKTDARARARVGFILLFLSSRSNDTLERRVTNDEPQQSTMHGLLSFVDRDRLAASGLPLRLGGVNCVDGVS